MSIEETVLNPVRTSWRTRLARFEVAEIFALPEPPLWRRAARAAAWTFALRILEKALALIRTVVVARFLIPRDFGLFAVVVIAVSALELLNAHGLRAALIEKHDDSRRDLDTVWSVLLLQNCLNAALLLALAHPIAMFFGDPAAVALIRSFAIVFLLEALVSIGTVHFEKRMLFHKQFAFLMSGALIDLAVALAVAAVFHTVWALVAGAVAGKAARLLASYMLQDFRPRLRFKWLNLRHLFRLDGWMWISTVLWFVLAEGDSVFVGRVFGLTVLGIYAVAQSLVSITRTDVAVMLQRLVFSSFSSNQDPALVRAGYLKLLRGTALCVVPVSVGLAALAPEITMVLLGYKWMMAIPVVSMLALLGGLHVFLHNASTLLKGTGEQRQSIVAEIIFLTVAAALAVPLSGKLHLVGIALAMTLGAAAAWAWAERCVLMELNISFREMVQAFESSIAATLVMLATIYLLRGWFREATWLNLLAMIAGAGFMYLFTTAIAALSRRPMLKANSAAG